MFAIRLLGPQWHVCVITIQRIFEWEQNLAVAEFHSMESSAERRWQHGSAEGISAELFFVSNSSCDGSRVVMT